MSSTCLACGGTDLEPVVDLGEAPVLVGALTDDPEQARQVPRGHLDLSVCTRCAHVANVAFDPALVDYDASYDNSLHFSPTFQHFADELAARLVDAHDLHGRRIVELGSGSGDFLRAICALGGNTGVGFDPTYDGDSGSDAVTLVPDYFRPGEHLGSYDLLVCRHVLEHLDEPAALMESLAREASPEQVHYFEVPAGEFNFGPHGLWDCIYPHVSYFCAQSLRALVTGAGFEVVREGSTFDGQFLYVEVRVPGGDRLAGSSDPEAVLDPDAVAEHLSVVRSFGRRYAESVASWRSTLEGRTSRGESLALWGAGSKGVNFLNAVDDDHQLTVIDLNPRKWGRYLPGTGHRIDGPESLPGTATATVIVTNPMYRSEIVDILRSLDVHADVVTV